MEKLSRLRENLLDFGATFILLWIIMFIIVFSDSLSWPAVPYLIREFLSEEPAVVAVLGLSLSIFNSTKIVANILGALLGDKVDRSLVVLLALLFFPASFALLLFARDHIWIIGSYILFGIFYGILAPPLNAMVASSIPGGSRGTLFGIFNLSWIVSQIPAPIIGGLLSKTIFLRFPLILSLALSLFTLILFIVFRGTLRNTAAQHRPNPSYETKDLTELSSRRLLLLCSAQLFSGLGSGVLSPITTAYLIYALKTTTAEMGLAYSLGWALATAFAQIPGGKLSDKLGYKRVIVVSTLISSPLVLLLPFSRTLEHFILIAALSCFSGNLASPAFSAYITVLMGEKKLSKGFGLTSASFGVGSIVGPIAGSFLWTTFQPNYLPPFAMSSISFLLTLPFIATLKEK
ncbi:MAG: MFS transporter [Candidatus Bathyarchaeia archaeon]